MNRSLAAPSRAELSAPTLAAPVVQRRCGCGTHTPAGGECGSCAAKRGRLQRRAAFGPEPEAAVAPPIVHEVLRRPGRPLDEATRAFFEPRFGQDFSRVRVHTDAQAAESAAAVNALAYTVGRDVVFGADQFAPHAPGGRRLLAHELTHTLQQGTRPAGLQALRVGPDSDACEQAAERYATSLTYSAVSLAPPSDNPTGPLVLQRQTATSAAPPTSPNPPGEAPSRQQPKCGPDATDWFVRQVNTAMTDRDVLMIQGALAQADFFARLFGVSASQVAEAGATTAVAAQEASLGSRAPARTPAIRGQLTAGAGSVAAVAAAVPPGILSTPPTVSPVLSPSSGAAVAMLGQLAIAALAWRALVNHAARYDFKAHADSMNHPRGATCPDDGCPPGEVGIVTICPGANPENCYQSDLPGNLFYALIGRHAGWSELTLQLGSQLAELTDVTPRPARPAITWDTPDDTAAISLGFRLPLPLSRSALCSAVPPARGSLALRTGCRDCLDPTPSVIR